MQRALSDPLRLDLGKRILLLSGPRQCGKTTLARSLEQDSDYLNFDVPEDRLTILKRSWRKDCHLLILDELHKMPNWKLFLKGIYDQQAKHQPIIVTGSARLDISRRAGDSLVGRHFTFRLHPLTLRELNEMLPERASLSRLMTVGGFPEPYLSSDEDFPARWRRAHLELILRQDVIDLEQVREINQIMTLTQLMRTRVGSTLSLNSLAEDLQVDFSTVKRWISILESLYVVFRVTPWSRNVARSLTKASKFYFYDNGQVLGDEGARFENLMANALLREVHWAQDVKGREVSLHYLRNRSGDEIDFCIVERQKIIKLIEAKWSDDSPHRAFRTFKNISGDAEALQLVAGDVPTRDYPFNLRVCAAEPWLRQARV